MAHGTPAPSTTDTQQINIKNVNPAEELTPNAQVTMQKHTKHEKSGQHHPTENDQFHSKNKLDENPDKKGKGMITRMFNKIRAHE